MSILLSVRRGCLRAARRADTWLGLRAAHRRGKAGAVTVLFALTAVALAGLVGLGAEAGTWYVIKRKQQNAADAAAIAGAITLMTQGGEGNCATRRAAAIASSIATASANGFTHGSDNVSVAVQVPPPASDPFHSRPCAAFVQITRSAPTVFAALAVPGSIQIGNVAVAEVRHKSRNCVLALDRLHFNGTISVAGNCGLEANATASDAISISGSSGTFSSGMLTTPGGCSGQCPGPSILSTNALPGSDPFTAIYDPVSNTGLSFTATRCVATEGNNWGPATLTPSWTAAASPKAYCGQGNSAGLKVSPNTTLDLAPGTYVFYNMSVDFQGTVTCSACGAGAGVTIILAGSQASRIGSLTIGAGASVTLTAPAVNAVNAAFNGVLFYVDYHATDPSNGNAAVDITAGSGSILTGGMYFPSVTLNFGGNANTQSRCTNIVAKDVSLSGTTRLDVSACAPETLSQINVLAVLE
ncbi:MAG: pilus assembly protein TadG-related protein [Acetobacteraceae bacterium]